MVLPLISVIVTAYNKDKYINRCLNSIVVQKYRNLQVIIVDDGSTDNTFSICDDFRKKFDNVELYCQGNGGVSSARNTGLRYVRGEYVIFVDGDDFLNKDYVLQLSKNRNFDLVQTGFSVVKQSGEIDHCIDSELIIGENNIVKRIFNKKSFPFFAVPWAKMYTMSIINEHSIKFQNQSFGEDTIFVLQYLKYVRTVKTLNYIGYNNVIVPGTLSRKKINGIWQQCLNIIDVAVDTFNFESSESWSFLYLRNIKLALLNSVDSLKEFKKVCLIIVKDPKFKKVRVDFGASKSDFVLNVLLSLRQIFLTYEIVKYTNRLR